MSAEVEYLVSGRRQLSRFVFFFFQAEDGIRDLVRSRGLGDVYKRQARYQPTAKAAKLLAPVFIQAPPDDPQPEPDHHPPVSYTHLTLPTSDLV